MQLKKQMTRRRQKGFTLIELAIAALIAGMAATISLYYDAQQILYDKVHGQVDQLKALGSALGKYEATYAGPLTAGSVVTGVSAPLAPTVAELKALGMLDANFSPKNYYGGGYGTKLRLHPTGCSGSSCSIFGIAYTTTPVVNAMKVLDNSAAGEATAYGGGDIAVSTSIAANTLAAQQGSWKEPNPLGSVAGILAYRVLYSNAASVGSSTTSFSTNIDMTNHAITGVDYISGTVGKDLEIKTANGKDMYLQNINDTPSSNLYANFVHSTFTNDVTVMGTTYARGLNNNWSVVTGLSNGSLNAQPMDNDGSINTNDIYLRSTGKWVSQMQGVSSSTTTSIGKVASLALGTHRFCVLSGVQNNMDSGVSTKTNQWVSGTVNGAWTYNSNGAVADFGQVTCFD